MYIKTIQEDYLNKVSGATYRSITSAEGLKTLIPEIQKLSGQTERRSKMVALDQTRKTMASLDNARMKQNGITKFKWRHSSAGAEPRKTHQELDGKIFDLDKGAYDRNVGRYIMPAELPNCKCFMVPVIELIEA